MTTKLEMILAAIVAVLVLLIVGDLVARKHGAESCVAGDKTVAAAAEVKDAHVQAAGTIAESKEGSHREAALATPAAGVPDIVVQPDTVASCPAAAPAARPAPRASAPAAGAGARGEGGGLRAAEEAAFVDALNQYRQRCVQRAHASDVEVTDRDRLLIIRDAVARGEKPPE